MKKLICLLIILICIACSNESNNEDYKYDSPPQGKYIEWFGNKA